MKIDLKHVVMWIEVPAMGDEQAHYYQRNVADILTDRNIYEMKQLQLWIIHLIGQYYFQFPVNDLAALTEEQVQEVFGFLANRGAKFHSCDTGDFEDESN